MSDLEISLEALQIVDAIDRRGSYAAAAEELNKVPSAISYSVQKLETALGVTLFHRVGRRSVLTPAGKYLLENGRQLLTSAQNLAAQTREVATGWEPRIRIAIDTAYDSRPLFCALNEFLLDSPPVEFDVYEEVLSGTWEQIVNDRVDLVLGGQGPVPTHQGYRSEEMPNLEMIFVVSPRHAICKEVQPISAERIALERLVVVHDSATTEIPRSIRFLQSQNYCYVTSMNYKLGAQLSGIGVGFLPRRTAAPFLESGELIELQTEIPPAEHANYLVWKLANKGRGLQKLRPIILRHYRQYYGLKPV